MKYDSRKLQTIIPALLRSGRWWVLMLGLCVFAVACITYGHVQKKAARDRGIHFTHKEHMERGLECAMCHSSENEGDANLTLPNHDVCSSCHDIPDDKTDTTTCKRCHTREDMSLDKRTPLLDSEKIFSHAPHLAKEVACTECHFLPYPDSKAAPLAKMQVCINCHQKTKPSLTDCSTCHTTLRKDVRPQFRGDSRIPHDSPQIWLHVHGQESKVNPAFCTTCHTDKASCEDCHRKNAPTSHTAAWRDHTHGLQARWDRSKCVVCHEEDSCLKCHQNTEPASHRAGWESPMNGHCVSCHFPAEQNNCTVCHEKIDHEKAVPSPHNLGVFPSKCSLCHPGGLPHRAPHVLNSSVRCVVCHK